MVTQHNTTTNNNNLRKILFVIWLQIAYAILAYKGFCYYIFEKYFLLYGFRGAIALFAIKDFV